MVISQANKAINDLPQKINLAVKDQITGARKIVDAAILLGAKEQDITNLNTLISAEKIIAELELPAMPILTGVITGFGSANGGEMVFLNSNGTISGHYINSISGLAKGNIVKYQSSSDWNIVFIEKLQEMTVAGSTYNTYKIDSIEQQMGLGLSLRLRQYDGVSAIGDPLYLGFNNQVNFYAIEGRQVTNLSIGDLHIDDIIKIYDQVNDKQENMSDGAIDNLVRDNTNTFSNY